MKLQKQHAIEILILLLLTDLVLIAFHLIHRLTPFLKDWHWSIEHDLGYSEFFQYVKLLWLICSFAALVKIRADYSYLALVVLFSYLLIDDSLSVHENMGVAVAQALKIQPMLRLRSIDFGELIVNGAIGGFFLTTIGGAYWFGRREFQQVCQRVALLMGCLVFFGVGIDALHSMSRSTKILSPLLGILEDGGEMMIMSVLCWYGISLLKLQDNLRSTPEELARSPRESTLQR